MTIKEKIQEAFVNAMKSKNNVAKIALSGLKSKITEAEKVDGNVKITETDIVKIIVKSIKQREESSKLYKEANRIDLYEKEENEILVLKEFLPKQMTIDEIENSLRDILKTLDNDLKPEVLKGKAIGQFNKLYNGMANIDDVKVTINNIITNK